VRGKVEGEVIVTKEPINFLTMLDLRSGVVKDEKHELYNRSIAGKILIFPNAIGSSVGAYSVYALKVNDAAPKAMICDRADITTASGCAIANITLVDRLDNASAIKSGSVIKIDAENGVITVPD
jgi:hypothetical protein